MLQTAFLASDHGSHAHGSSKVDVILGIFELVVAVAAVASDVPAEPSTRGSAPTIPGGIPAEQQARAEAQRAASARQADKAAIEALAKKPLPPAADAPTRP